MRRKTRTFAKAAGAAVLAVALVGAYSTPSSASVDAPPQISYAGKWSIETTGSNDSAHLTLQYPPSSSNDSGMASLSALGLEPGTFGGSGHAVQFGIRRDAGTFVCQGNAGSGSGGGTFKFEPNPQYVRDVVAAGFAAPTLREQVMAGMFDVGTSYVQAMGAAGLRGVRLDKLVDLKIFDLTPEFVAALHADFPDESIDGFVALHMVGVTPAYVDALRRAGVPNLSADNVSALRAAGVDQAFAERLATKGPHGLSIDEVVRLKETAP
jgi:hypothetical protein